MIITYTYAVHSEVLWISATCLLSVHAYLMSITITTCVYLFQVNWVQGDATELKTVEKALKDSDAAVHAIGMCISPDIMNSIVILLHMVISNNFEYHTSGLLFDVESGLANLNKIVSGSGSIPGESSTYDAITRTTAFNVIESIEKKQSMNIGSMLSKNAQRFPLMFVSAAEAGWPDVPFGKTVDGLAPEWLNKYLTAKRAVESRLKESNEKKGTIRSAVFRPSLIWDWTKFDVLPAIPIFNVAAAIGVPFVDKTVRIETLADAIVAGIEGDDVEGVQRVGAMEKLSQRK